LGKKQTAATAKLKLLKVVEKKERKVKNFSSKVLDVRCHRFDRRNHLFIFQDHFWIGFSIIRYLRSLHSLARI